MRHNRLDYDPDTKTLVLETVCTKKEPVRRKVWDVDPQRQIIDLLKDIRNEIIALRNAKSGILHIGSDPPSPPAPQPVSQVQPSGD